MGYRDIYKELNEQAEGVFACDGAYCRDRRRNGCAGDI